MRNNLPEFLLKIPEMLEVVNAEDGEIIGLKKLVDETLDEFFVDSITKKTIDFWEDLCGFIHVPSWHISRRRERIKARLIFAKTITPLTFKEIIERVGGVECEIIEDFDNYTATVNFVGRYGIPKYLIDIKTEVEAIRPFHIVVLYSFLYAILDNYGNFKLGALEDYTLQQMSEGKPLQEEEL